jgi:hypothetical protein
MSYTEQDFIKECILFNRLCGNQLFGEGSLTYDKVSPAKCATIFQKQLAIVHEEFDEMLQAAAAKDRVELLDGVVDVKVTLVWLMELMKSFDGEIPKAYLGDYYKDVLRLANIYQAHKLFENCFSPEYLMEACRRVAENNLSKYTIDKAVAEKWQSGSPVLNIRSSVVDGTVYYCLVNAEGKVKKPNNFVPVYLEDLV